LYVRGGLPQRSTRGFPTRADFRRFAVIPAGEHTRRRVHKGFESPTNGWGAPPALQVAAHCLGRATRALGHAHPPIAADRRPVRPEHGKFQRRLAFQSCRYGHSAASLAHIGKQAGKYWIRAASPIADMRRWGNIKAISRCWPWSAGRGQSRSMAAWADGRTCHMETASWRDARVERI